MKSKRLVKIKATVKATLVGAAIGWLCWQTDNVCHAQAAASNLSPDLQEVVKLSQSHMGDDVILNYIRSSGKSYRLSADDIIYLNSQGVSQGVISALQSTVIAPPNQVPVAATPMPTPTEPPPAPPATAPTPAAPASETEAPAPPAPEVSFNYFHDQLAPFGTWINIGGVWYWHPDQAIAANPDWRPYYDMGQWVETDNGLFWQSDYTWGDIPFHYGRWVLDPYRGWLWAPDYTWGPAWVFWRHAEGDGSIGWAPLPVGAVFVDGAFMFHGVRVGLDFDFGLGENCFTFVGYDHFHEGFFRMRGHEWVHHIGRERLHAFYGRSVIRNDFRRDEHGRFVNNGIGRERIEHFTHVTHSNFEERHPVGDRNQLVKQRLARPGAENAGAHFAGGQPVARNNGAPQNNSVSKVFRPPTTAPGGNNSRGNAGNGAGSKSNPAKK
jgi:hypothetical protein